MKVLKESLLKADFHFWGIGFFFLTPLFSPPSSLEGIGIP